MPEHREINELIAWYAAGTLADRDRQRVEIHLRDCRECCELAEQARDQVELSAVVAATRLTDHVAPSLLTRYVEMPAGLEPDTMDWIERKLESCADCRDAHQRLLEVERSLGVVAPARGIAEPREPSRWLASLWSGLATTLLRPTPALAYLLLLALLVPWLLTRTPVPEPVAPARPAHVLYLHGDRSVRDSTQPVLAPLILPASGTVLAILDTELSVADLDRLGFVVEITAGDEPLLSRPLTRADFDTEPGDRVVLPLLLDAGRLGAGTDHEITIRAVKPGDPLDGQPLFRRSVRRSDAEVPR